MQKTGQNWWVFDNPFDLSGMGKRKMAVHFEYEYVKCWRTGYKERLLTFVSHYANVTIKEASAIINDEDEATIDDDSLSVTEVYAIKRYGLELPYGYKSILDGDNNLANRARSTLTKRGFDLAELDLKGFGYCDEVYENSSDPDADKKNFFGYIIVPCIRAGLLEYYIGRDFIGNYLRYKNPDKAVSGIGKEEVLFNADALWLNDEVLLFEGWADAVTAGDNAVSSQGWTFSEKQLNIFARSPVKRVTVVGDKGYFKQAVQSAMRLIDIVEEVYATDLGEVCVGEEKDANEIGRQRTMDAVKKHSQRITILSGLQLIS